MIDSRQKKIRQVTLVGSLVNLLLSAAKILAGVFGGSAAMIADGIHSLSDLASDVVILVFVKVSSKGQNKSYDWGHGKFETLATLIVSIILIAVSVQLMFSGVTSVKAILGGAAIPAPGGIALVAAIVSIAAKEWMYRYTAIVGKRLNSPAVIANAWHHRSDAFSSVASLIGIGCAMAFGDRWVLLDPLMSCVISVAIMVVGIRMAIPSVKELLDVSLPDEMEDRIVALAMSVDGVKEIHDLKTRRNGPYIIMETHMLVDPQMSVVKAHDITLAVEELIKAEFGSDTQISIHVEPYGQS